MKILRTNQDKLLVGLSKVKIALAQYEPIKGNIGKNFKWHKKLCAVAADMGADVVVFPELSLTGYELPLLAALAQDLSSEVVQALSQTAVTKKITIIAGCPIKNKHAKPFIGAVICYPNGKTDIYSKQYLHQGESEYVAAGNENYFFTVNHTSISLAVCADFTKPCHPQDALSEGADIYLVSALISRGGFAKDSLLLADIAKTIKAPVLLSNFIGKTGGWDTAGQSAIWNSDGKAAFQGGECDAGIALCLIADREVKETRFIYCPIL